MNVTKATRDYISSKPYIKQALSANIINYSKLARKISKERRINKEDAILIACRRTFQRFEKSKNQSNITALLSKSKLQIRNKIVVIILEPDIRSELIVSIQKEIESKNEKLYTIRGINAITLVTTEEFLDIIKKKLSHNIVKVSKDLVEIIIKSSKEIENTPGVIGYIFSLLGENDINILETMSCWTDTILVISKKDLPKAMEMLNFGVENK